MSARASKRQKKRRHPEAVELDDDEVLIVKHEQTAPPSYEAATAVSASSAAAAASGSSPAAAVSASAESQREKLQFFSSLVALMAVNETMADTATRTAAEFQTTADNAILEFHRFMELKVFLKDTDAVKISPTPLMDHMWHAAILDTKFYAELQRQLCMAIHHNPQGGKDAKKREERLQNMRVVYRMQYGEDPFEAKPAPAAAAASSGLAYPASGPFTIFVKTMVGKTLTFSITNDTTVEDLQTMIRKKDFIPEDQQLIVYAGKQLQSGHKPHSEFKPLNRKLVGDYNIHPESILHLVLRLGGC